MLFRDGGSTPNLNTTGKESALYADHIFSVFARNDFQAKVVGGNQQWRKAADFMFKEDT